MANVIIGIHGLCNKPSKDVLQNWWKLAMEEGLRVNGFGVKMPKFEMVYWADILYDNPLDENEQNEDSPLFLKGKYVKGSANFQSHSHEKRKSVVDFLGKKLNKFLLNDDYTLNLSNVTDALMARYFGDLEAYYNGNQNKEGTNNSINSLIRQRLYKVLQKYKNDNIMLVSHSMGTIISYDVLTILAPEIPINTLITMGAPLGLSIIISKIAQEQKKYNSSFEKLTTPNNIVSKWFNFSDILDSVAFDYNLSNDYYPNPNGVEVVNCLVSNNYEIDGERNSHKSYGYLRTKEFSTALNEFICQPKPNIFKRIAVWFNKIYERVCFIQK